MKSEVLAANDPAMFVEGLCLDGVLDPFEEIVTRSASTIDWRCPRLGLKTLPTYWDEGTDQARRRRGTRIAIAGWIDALAGPVRGHNVLDLFSGCGSLSAELSAAGAARYLGVDANSALIAAANQVAASRCAFECGDVIEFVTESDLSSFTMVLLLYEALNGLERWQSAELLGALGQRLAPGTWVIGDIRDRPHMNGTAVELTRDCPYIAVAPGDVVIREFGYTSNGERFGSRYIGARSDGNLTKTALSVLTLMDKEVLQVMLIGAGMALQAHTRLIAGHSTDVSESAQNLFFAARVGGA
jgi:hypothetical protein